MPIRVDPPAARQLLGVLGQRFEVAAHGGYLLEAGREACGLQVACRGGGGGGMGGQEVGSGAGGWVGLPCRPCPRRPGWAKQPLARCPQPACEHAAVRSAASRLRCPPWCRPLGTPTHKGCPARLQSAAGQRDGKLAAWRGPWGRRRRQGPHTVLAQPAGADRGWVQASAGQPARGWVQAAAGQRARGWVQAAAGQRGRTLGLDPRLDLAGVDAGLGKDKAVSHVGVASYPTHGRVLQGRRRRWRRRWRQAGLDDRSAGRCPSPPKRPAAGRQLVDQLLHQPGTPTADLQTLHQGA